VSPEAFCCENESVLELRTLGRGEFSSGVSPDNESRRISSRQNQLHSGIYRPTLTVLSLACAAGCRPRCRRSPGVRHGRPAHVSGMHHSPLTRVGQPEDLS
jgi:hypothetical protein